MLYRSELKKLLFTQKGLLLLSMCLLLKFIFLFAVPEMKDSRIQLSQKQYDKYLIQLHGENTVEKSAWILEEYKTCTQTIASREDIEQRRNAGSLSDAEWEKYLDMLDTAYLHENAAKIFSEKAEQFAAQPDNIPPAHYIYEYGWQTIFTLGQFPDIFLLFGLLLLSAQCFPFEAQSGMLPVLLSCKNGRTNILAIKLLSLLTVAATAAILSGSLEATIFVLRGWCNDPSAPLYSIGILINCGLTLSLMQGYILVLMMRTCAALLFIAFIFSVSIWIKSAQNIVFLGLCLLALPLLRNVPTALFSPAGFLYGTNILLWIDQLSFSILIPIAVNIGYTTMLFVFSVMRQRKGL